MSDMDNQSDNKGLYILRFYGISIIVGVVTGLVGSVFQILAHSLHINKDNIILFFSHAHHFLPPMMYMLVCGVMALIAYGLVKCFAPEGSGSGVQEIEGVLLAERPIFWRRLLPVKFVAGILAIGGNMVVGREGPTIQMGGNIGEMLGEKFGLSREKRNILVGAGAASGLACAFNAPLAGIVFILEEMRACFNFSFLSFKSVAISCVFSTIVLRLFVGQNAEIAMPVFQYPLLSSLLWFFLFGLLVGVIGLGFNLALMKTLSLVDKLSNRQKWGYALLIGGIVGLFSWYLPEAVGGGYQIISQALQLPFSVEFLIVLFFFIFNDIGHGFIKACLSILQNNSWHKIQSRFNQMMIIIFYLIGLNPGKRQSK
jgi:CIC family chloride channel protein